MKKENNLQALFTQYERLVFSIINQIVNNNAISEDLVIDTFSIVNRNVNKLLNNTEEERVKTKNYICIIARQVAIKKMTQIDRNKTAEKLWMEQRAAMKTNPKLKADIYQAFNKLSQNNYETVIKFWVVGMSYTEIALEEHAKEDVIRKRISRCRKILEKELKESRWLK